MHDPLKNIFNRKRHDQRLSEQFALKNSLGNLGNIGKFLEILEEMKGCSNTEHHPECWIATDNRFGDRVVRLGLLDITSCSSRELCRSA